MFVYVKNMWIDLEDVFCVCVGWTVIFFFFCSVVGCLSQGKGWVSGCGCGGVGGPFGLFDLFSNYLHLNFLRCPIIRGGESVVINSAVCFFLGGQVCKVIKTTLFIFVKRSGGPPSCYISTWWPKSSTKT